MPLRIGTHTVIGHSGGMQHLSRMQADEQSTLLREAKLHGHAYFATRSGGHFKISQSTSGLYIEPTSRPSGISTLASRPGTFGSESVSGDSTGRDYLMQGMTSAERGTIIHRVKTSGRAAFIHKNAHYSVAKTASGQYNIAKEGQASSFGLRPPSPANEPRDTSFARNEPPTQEAPPSHEPPLKFTP